ncbi:MAG: GlsB/YeaQ/YmgE family stress response membrane protein [Bacteroidota bacterium]
MNIIIFLIIGAVAGWLGGTLTKGSGFGLLGNIIVGIIGSFIGGYLFDFLNIDIGNGMLGSIITAAVGAIVLISLVRLINK